MTFPPAMRPPGWPPSRPRWMHILPHHPWDTLYRKQPRAIWVPAWLALTFFSFVHYHRWRALGLFFAIIFLGLIVVLPMTARR